MHWYASNCNDDWEHAFGVEIGNLDNPGWTVAIDLEDTPLASAPFDRIVVGEDDDNFDDEGRQVGPWWTCWVEERRFQARCGPEDLEHVLEVFLDWCEAADS